MPLFFVCLFASKMVKSTKRNIKLAWTMHFFFFFTMCKINSWGASVALYIYLYIFFFIFIVVSSIWFCDLQNHILTNYIFNILKMKSNTTLQQSSHFKRYSIYIVPRITFLWADLWFVSVFRSSDVTCFNIFHVFTMLFVNT